VSAFLSLQIKDKHSRDLLLTGRIIDAHEACRLGIATEVVAREELAKRIQTLSATLIANSPQSLVATKQLIAAQNRPWLDAAIVVAMEANAQARDTADLREGVAAFLEKRKPIWSK
jgi:methylglutaconyl-CoA hydratase